MKINSVQILILTTLAMAMSLAAQTANALRAAADKVNLNIGMAIGNQINNGDSVAIALIKSQSNILVNENSMKFGSVEPTRGNFNFSQPEVVVKFAEANGMKMRGHNLLWNSQIGYASNLNKGRVDALEAMKTHIDSTVLQFKGRISEWDVVNEPCGVGDTSTTLRPGSQYIWRAQIGDDYIDSALVYAHRADPDAKLLINDFWVEELTPKAQTLYNLVKGLKERGVPITGVGFQCHTGNNISRSQLSQNIKRFGDLGLTVSLTEIDVSSTGTTMTGWKSLMDACMENANCISFVTWGVDDGHSWLNRNFPAGKNCDCLLNNAAMQPKTNIINTLINSMNAANPTIAAARKVYQGTTTGVKTLPSLSHKNSNIIRTQTGIQYSLPKSGNVKLDLIRMDGKKVATLVNAHQSMGEQAIALDMKLLAPGLYFFDLRIDGKQEVTKMMVGL